MGTQNRRLGSIRIIDDNLEKLRVSMQMALDSCKTINERRKLGQFSTPTALAHDIVAFGLDCVDTTKNIRFFDPAFGTGAFYSALLQVAGEQRISKATAIEIDPLFAKAANKLWLSHKINIINDDFTTSEPDDKYNLIICNPPYVRHHLIASDRKREIRNKTEDVSGVKLSGFAGLYCHFLLQSIQWMNDNAVAGWLIPSEFMDVNYGAAIKTFLLSDVELFRIHRFDPKNTQFEDALVSSAIVWFRNKKPNNHSVVFSYGGSLAQPQKSITITVDSLKREPKWTRFPCQLQKASKQAAPKLKDYFDVRRGVATGGNDFFILEESRIKALGLTLEFFRPILPSARFLKTTEIEADAHGYPILPQRLFLLDCRLNEEEVRARYPRLWQYLESGKDSIATGYLCKMRKCWYFQEQRDAPMLVCTYMGRASSERSNAFRFILNNSQATVTNSYLALYPKEKLSERIACVPSLKRTIWEMLNRLPSDSMHTEGRVYGGGLQKIEPKELLNVSLPCSLEF
ncbi:Eco57I restriction-modification methylase domain-containing protein [Desulfovibrio sp. 86]|uniref:site-specific DNA-methyltransferase (adenine-specific) n=1 Tax=uncultured Desulfovibrio sp. TaxID=167968 RepID=A0A212L7M5_9BACT|nr:Eco57I restriction-modification methylase domain-containing protein [Desulfovibrio sp. 86]SCM73582.1 Modification methylase SalI [uncultured Desulfovibrio sp.]VZH34293.1 Modification methylase SalI [Desulfovibrio sp. 86]